MADLATLEQAKAHLGIPLALTDNDADVRLKLAQASDTVIDFIKSRADLSWTSDTVPGPVQAACLLLLTHYYENRGQDQQADDAVWASVRRLLVRYTDSALA